ncbi:hypothetical protein [Vibrio sp. SSH13-20]|uniref:hypothetical protein n=1 Tax=Vibrio sp. SSH13-20 TaxID=3136668 RepID=UPI0032C44062
MKKSILAISISVLLSACGGGSDGGSSEPVQPPKPVVPEETIQGIADALNFDPELVSAVCNDVSFECSIEQGTKSNDSVSLIDKEFLLGFGTNSEGNFWNDGLIAFEPSLDFDVNNIAEFGSQLQFTLKMHDGFLKQYYVRIAPDSVAIDETTGKVLVDLDSFIDVYTQDMNETLMLLEASENPALTARFTVKFKDGGDMFFKTERDLSSEGFKAAFSMLLQKNNELFEGEPEDPEPENTAPVVNDAKAMVVNQNEINFFEFTATDKESEYLKFTIDVHPFNGEGVHSGAFDMSYNGVLQINSEYLEAGIYTFTVTASDGELTGSKDFEVLVKATEEPEPDNESPSVALVGYEPYMTVEVGEVYTFNVVTEDKENDPVTVLLGDTQGFANLHNGVITVTPTKDHLGAFTLGVLVNDPYHGSATGFPFNVVPAKPAQTFDDFANLIGEPVEQLEVLFKSHNLVWKITDNNEPIISIEHSDWSVVEFNLASGVMSFGGSAHITNGELLTPLEVLEYTAENNEGQILPFEAENLELGRKYETGEILYFWSKTKFTNEILNVLMINTEHSNPVIEAKVSAYNELTGENVEYNQRVDAYVLDAVYRQPLLEILVKHIK